MRITAGQTIRGFEGVTGDAHHTKKEKQQVKVQISERITL